MCQMCSNKDLLQELDKALNLINQQANKEPVYYMSWQKFVKVFPKIYNIVYFDGSDWYFKSGFSCFKINLFWESFLPDDVDILEIDNKIFKNKE